MLKEMIKGFARTVAPAWASEQERRRFVARQAEELLARAPSASNPEAQLDLVNEYSAMKPQQMRAEVLEMVSAVAGLGARRGMEIGSYNGGTLFLLARACRPEARLLSLDWKYREGRERIFPRFALPGQVIGCLEGDSHAQATLAKASAFFSGEPLDFLFIDGDHSYDGVKADYEMYGPLVRPGGLIFFHDIVADLMERKGMRGVSDSGEVPRFWMELRGKVAESR